VHIFGFVDEGMGWAEDRLLAKRRRRSHDAPPAIVRAEAFCEANGIRVPVLMAPMARACPPSLAFAVGSAGGMGACGALLYATAGDRRLSAEGSRRDEWCFSTSGSGGRHRPLPSCL